MAMSKNMLTSQKLSTGSPQDSQYATPSSPPSKYGNLCHCQCLPPNRHLKGSPAVSPLGDWDMHGCSNACDRQSALLPPSSPSESDNSSSAFSTFGSASSFSTSNFNDTCSYEGIPEELSSSSIGSTDANKLAMVYPGRLSFQEMQIRSKPLTGRVDAMLKPAIDCGSLCDEFVKLPFEKGRRIGNGPPFVNGCAHCQSACTVNALQQCNVGERQEGCLQQSESSVVAGNNVFTQNPRLVVSSDTSFSSRQHDSRCINTSDSGIAAEEPALPTCHSKARAVFQFGISNCHEFTESLISDYRRENCSNLSVDDGKESKERKKDNLSLQLRGSRCKLPPERSVLEQPSTLTEGPLNVAKFCHLKSCTAGFQNAREYLEQVLDCESKVCHPHIASLKHLPDTLTACREMSLSQELCFHQSPYSCRRPPLIPRPKLSDTFSSPEGSREEALKRRSFTSFSSEVSESLPWHARTENVKEVMDTRSVSVRSSSKSRTPVYSHEYTVSVAGESGVAHARLGCTRSGYVDELPAPLVSAKNIEKRADKSSTLTCRESICVSTSSVDSPAATFESKSNGDWRSRSLGERGRPKSTARSLEAAFSGYKSSSLLISKSRVPKSTSKNSGQFNDSKIMKLPLNFIGDSQEQSLRLDFYERAINGKCCNNEDIVRRSGPLSSKVKEPSTEMHPSALETKNSVMNRSKPVAYKRKRLKFELFCKPLLPVTQSIYQIPSTKGASSMGMPLSSKYGQQWQSSGECKLMQASVQCTSIDGLPCYTMTVEGEEEMIIAKYCSLQGFCSTEGSKWVYTFCTGRATGKGLRAGGWRWWVKRENKAASDVIGIMQASSISDDPDGDETLSLEFVLYDGRAPMSAHSQSLRICPKDVPSHKRLVLGFAMEGVRPSSSNAVPSRLSHQGSADVGFTSLSIPERNSLTNGGIVVASTTSVNGHPGHRSTCSLDDGWSDSDFTDSENQAHDDYCPFSHLELLAMVIRLPSTSHHVRRNVLDDAEPKGGWGLKFLMNCSESAGKHRITDRVSVNFHESEKLSDSSISTCHTDPEQQAHDVLKPSLDCSSWYGCRSETESSHGTQDKGCVSLYLDGINGVGKRNHIYQDKARLSECLTLILPMGDHTRPPDGEKRPSSLIERWHSGGSCECGGWDLGCGIEVLSTEMQGATSDTKVFWEDQPVSIFTQGTRRERVFSLSTLNQGHYNLKFQERLTPLRAFASVVAILHGRSTLASRQSSSSSTSITTMSSAKSLC